jgi:hypothetical protein
MVDWQLEKPKIKLECEFFMKPEFEQKILKIKQNFELIRGRL